MTKMTMKNVDTPNASFRGRKNKSVATMPMMMVTLYPDTATMWASPFLWKSSLTSAGSPRLAPMRIPAKKFPWGSGKISPMRWRNVSLNEKRFL